MKAVGKVKALESVDVRMSEFVQKMLSEWVQDKERGTRRVRRLEFLLSKEYLLRDILIDCFATPFFKEVTESKAWLVVEVGNCPADELRKDQCLLVDTGYSDHYLDWRVRNAPEKLELFVLSGRMFGFTGKVSYEDLCYRADLLGFEKCSPEVAFQVARQHREAVIAEQDLLFSGLMQYRGSWGSWRTFPTINVRKRAGGFDVRIGYTKLRTDVPYTPDKKYVFARSMSDGNKK